MLWELLASATPTPLPLNPLQNTPLDPAVVAAIATLVTAVGTAVALTISAIAKMRSGVSVRNKERDADLIEDRKQLALQLESTELELDHMEDQVDKEVDNRRRLNDYIAGVRWRLIEKYGPEVAAEIMQEMPEMTERTYSRGEVRAAVAESQAESSGQ